MSRRTRTSQQLLPCVRSHCIPTHAIQTHRLPCRRRLGPHPLLLLLHLPPAQRRALQDGPSSPCWTMGRGTCGALGMSPSLPNSLKLWSSWTSRRLVTRAHARFPRPDSAHRHTEMRRDDHASSFHLRLSGFRLTYLTHCLIFSPTEMPSRRWATKCTMFPGK